MSVAPPAGVSVIPVQPYTKEDLARQSLADSLQHFSQRNQQSVSSNPLLFLYPDQPRQQAFAHYCSSPGTHCPLQDTPPHCSSAHVVDANVLLFLS